MSYSAASEAKISLNFTSNTDGIEQTKKSWEGLTTSLKDTSSIDAAREALDNTVYSVQNLGSSFGDAANTIGNTPLSIEDKLTSITDGFSRLEDVAGNRIAKKVFPDLIEQLSGFTTAGDPVYKLVSDLSEETNNFDKSLVLISKSSKFLITGINKLEIGVSGLEEAFKALGIQSEFVNNAFNKIQNVLGIGENLVKVANISYKTREAFEDITETLGGVGTAIVPVAGGMGSLIKTSTDLDKPLQDLTTTFGTLDIAASLFGKKTLALFSKFGFQATVIGNIALNLGKVGDAVDKLTKQWNELYRGFETMQTLGVDTTFAELATSIGAAGEKILFNVQATKQLISSATQAYAKVEESVAYVRTLSAGSKYSVEELTGSLQTLAKDGVGNAVKSGDLAISVYNNLSAGIGTAAGKIGEALEVSQTAAKYASATKGNLDETQKALNFTSQAFGRSAAESSKTMELLDKIVQQGVTNSSELAANIGGLAATAASTGNSIESTFAATALATRTLGADAYTAIQRLYSSLSSMAPQSKKALDELGFTINAEVLKTKDLTTMMQELYKAAGGNTEKLQEIIPESIAFRGALSLMTTSVADAQSVIGDFGTVTGKAVDEMFDESQKTITNRSQALANGFEEVFANAGQKIVKSGFFDAGLRAVENILKYFQNLPEPMNNVLGLIVTFNMGLEKVTGVIGALLGVLGAVASVSLTILGFYRGGEFFNGLVKGFQAAGDNANIFVKGLSAIQGGLKSALGVSIQLTDKGLKPIFDESTKIGQTMKKLSSVFNEVSTKSTPLLIGLSNALKTVTNDRVDIAGIFKTDKVENKINYIKKAVNNIKEAFTFNNDKSAVASLGEAFSNSFKAITSSIGSLNIGKAFSKATGDAVLKAKDLTRIFGDFEPSLVKYVGTGTSLFKNISKGIDTLKNNAGKFQSIDMLKSSVKDTIENISKSYEGFATNPKLANIAKEFNNLFKTDIKGIKYPLSRLAEEISTIKFNPKGILEGLKKIPDQLQYNLKYVQSYAKYFTKYLVDDLKTITPNIDLNKLKDNLVVGLYGVVDKIQNKFKDLKLPNYDKIFNGLKNGLNTLAGIDVNKIPSNLNNSFSSVINNLNKSFNGLTNNVKQLATNLNNALNTKIRLPDFSNIFNSLGNNAKEIFSSITKNINNLTNKFNGKMFEGLNTQLSELSIKTVSRFNNIKESIFTNFKTIGDNVKQNLSNSFKGFSDLFTNIKFNPNNLINSFKQIPEQLQDNLKYITKFSKDFNDTIKNNIKSITPKFDLSNLQNSTKITTILDNIQNKFKNIKLDNINNVFESLQNKISTIFNTKLNTDKLGNSVKAVISNIGNTFNSLTENAKQLGSNITNALNIKPSNFSGILNNSLSKLNTIQKQVFNDIGNTFGRLNDKFSNSKLFSSISDQLNNLNSKVKDNFNKVSDTVNSSFKGISNNVKNLFNGFKFNPDVITKSLQKIPEQLKENFKSVINLGKDFGTELANNIKSISPKVDISKFKNTIITETSDIINNLQNKFNSIKLGNFDTKSIQNNFNNLFNSDVISKQFKNITNNISQSLNTVNDKFKDFKSTILNTLNIKPNTSNFLNTFKNNFKTLTDSAKETFNNIIKNVDLLKEKVLSSKIFSGISNELNSLTDKTKNIFSTLSSSISTNFKGINLSPLTEGLSNSFKVITANLNIAKEASTVFGQSLMDSFAQSKVGSAVIPILSGAMKGLSGTFALVGNVARGMWTSILAPALPLIALVGVLGVLRDFIPVFGSVTESSKNFTKSTYEIGKASKSAGKEMTDLLQTNKELKGESEAQLDSFSAKAISIVGQVFNGIQKAVSVILNTVSFGLLKPLTTFFDWVGDNVQKVFKSLANNVESAFDAEAIIRMNKEIEDSSIYVQKLKKELKGFKEGNVLPIDILKQETKKAKEYYLEFAKEAEKTISNLGNSDKDEALKKKINEQVKATKESYEKIAKLTKENEAILKKATIENRTLTAEEINKLNEGESAAFASKKETIQQEIKLLNERYEEAKKIDAASAEGYKKQIDALNAQVSELDKTQKIIQEKRKILNEFTNEIHKNIKDVSEVAKGSTKEFEAMTKSLDQNAKTATGARKQALEDTSTQIKSFSKNITELENYSNKVKTSQGKLTTFQTQTLNSLVSSTKAVGLQLDDALNETFNPSEFQTRIEGWLNASQTAMEEFQDPELIKNTIKHIEETEVTFVDATGKVIKTTLDKTLTKDQLRNFIRLKLDVIDKELEIKAKTWEEAKQSIQDGLDLGKIDSSTAIEDTNKVNAELRSLKLKSNEDKLKLIEKEFGTESKEYKDQFKLLKDLQVQSSKDLLKEQTDLLQARYDKQLQAFNKEKLLADKATNDGTTDKELKTLDELAEKEIELKINNLNQELELNQDNSAKKLEIEQKLLEATNELDKKKLENKQRILDREFEVANNKVIKEKQLLEKNTVKGNTDNDLAKFEKLAEQELQIKADYIQKELATKEKGSKEAIKLEQELNSTLNNLEKTKFDNSVNLLDRKFEKNKNVFNKEKLLADKATNDGATNQELQKLDELAEKEINLELNKLQEKSKLYKDNSKEKIEIEQKILEITNSLDKKKLENKQRMLDRELDIANNKINKEKQLIEKNTVKGSTDNDLNQIEKLAEQELQTKADYIKKQLINKEKGSNEAIKLEQELNNVLTNLEKTRLDNSIKLMDRKFEKQKTVIDKEKLLANKATRDGSTNAEIDKIEELNTKELQLDINKLQEKSKLYKEGTNERLAIEKELAIKLDNLDEQRNNNAKNRRKRELDDKLAAIDLENTELEKALITGNKSREQVEDAQNINAQKLSLERQNYLTAELKHLQVGSKEYVDTLKQLGTEQINYQKALIDKQVTLLNRNLEQQKNTIQSNINELTKYTNNYDLLIKSLEVEKSIRESNNNFIKESANLDIQTNELRLKTTGDIVEKAQIQYQIVQQQNILKEQELDIELSNLETQTEINKANREKEKITQRINKLELERNILTTKNQLEIAKLNNESSNNIKALELQIDSLEEQNRMLDSNTELTEKQSIADTKNLENQKQLVLRRKELNKEAANIDDALALQQIEIANYDKQLQQLNVKNKLLDTQTTSQLALNDRITKAYERQTNLLNEQKNSLDSVKSATEAQLGIAMAGAKTEKQKEILQQQYNSVKLLILDKQQKADLLLLELQQKQNNLALKRQEIENNIAKTKQQAAILEAQIEEKKVLARKDATDEEKQLAALNVQAAKQSLVALEEQSGFIQQQKKDQEFIYKLNKENKLREQNTAMLQERSNIAATTKSTVDDQIVANDATNQFYGSLNKLSTELANFKLSDDQPINTPKLLEPKLPEPKEQTIKIELPKTIDLKSNISSDTKKQNTDKQPKKDVIVNIDARVTYTGTVSQLDKDTFNTLYNNQTNNLITEIERRL